MKELLVYCKAKCGRQTELAMHQVTPQTLSNWLYRRKRPSLDKYLALMEFAIQNAAMEMPPRVRKLLNELEAYAKRNRIKQKDLAKDLGVVQQQLSDWLRGHRTPNAERILKIQEYLRSKKS
jgi:DNA-binding transcriptional regulator YiaG